MILLWSLARLISARHRLPYLLILICMGTIAIAYTASFMEASGLVDVKQPGTTAGIFRHRPMQATAFFGTIIGALIAGLVEQKWIPRAINWLAIVPSVVWSWYVWAMIANAAPRAHF